ncbi:MAG: hypothetical protein KAX65_01835 [Caldilineaceae bacterium]|nr:hypothetical protein [Caldilineaceae bacterium]
MSEQNSGVTPGAGGQDGGTPGAGGDGQPTAEQLAAELASLRAALRAANAESMTRRKKLDELEAAEEERKAAQLSEVEKARKAQADAEAKALATEERLRTAAIRNAVVLAASKANFYDPEDAFRLADLAEVQVAEDGTVTGVDNALKTLTKAKPHLVKVTSGGGEINSTAAGRQTRPSADELVRQKRASGAYTPI